MKRLYLDVNQELDRVFIVNLGPPTRSLFISRGPNLGKSSCSDRGRKIVARDTLSDRREATVIGTQSEVFSAIFCLIDCSSDAFNFCPQKRGRQAKLPSL